MTKTSSQGRNLSDPTLLRRHNDYAGPPRSSIIQGGAEVQICLNVAKLPQWRHTLAGRKAVEVPPAVK